VPQYTLKNAFLNPQVREVLLYKDVGLDRTVYSPFDPVSVTRALHLTSCATEGRRTFNADLVSKGIVVGAGGRITFEDVNLIVRVAGAGEPPGRQRGCGVLPANPKPASWELTAPGCGAGWHTAPATWRGVRVEAARTPRRRACAACCWGWGDSGGPGCWHGAPAGQGQLPAPYPTGTCPAARPALGQHHFW
jgi:hypothetical protein